MTLLSLCNADNLKMLPHKMSGWMDLLSKKMGCCLAAFWWGWIDRFSLWNQVSWKKCLFESINLPKNTRSIRSASFHSLLWAQICFASVCFLSSFSSKQRECVISCNPFILSCLEYTITSWSLGLVASAYEISWFISVYFSSFGQLIIVIR